MLGPTKTSAVISAIILVYAGVKSLLVNFQVMMFPLKCFMCKELYIVEVHIQDVLCSNVAAANLGSVYLKTKGKGKGTVVPVLKHHIVQMYKVQDHTLTLEESGQLHTLLAPCTGKSLIPTTQESEM